MSHSRRVVYRLQRSVCVVFLYLIVYLVISYSVSPEAPVTFVSNELQFGGGRYAVMFLFAPGSEVLTDAEGADVFASRRCGNCFITNNKGFLPMAEFDAVLVMGRRHLLQEGGAFMEPARRYLIETDARCVRDGLKCSPEPKVTSFTTRQSYTLCTLCDKLILDRDRMNN